jgi:archaellum biogenesis ATPase FlaH
MIKVIVGSKGSGKTARLVDDLNLRAVNDAANVVCIEAGRRLDGYVKYQIRLVEITEYPVQGYKQLLSFIAGLSAKDFDITHIYIDSIYKVSGDDNLDNLAEFLAELDKFAIKDNFHVMIILSAEPENLPESIRRYC